MAWLLLFLALTLAAEPSVAPALTDAGWRGFGFEGKSENRFRLAEDGAIEVASRASVSMLYHDVAVDLTKTRCLAWRWRVDRSMPPTDLSRRGGDDRPLAVYVMFPYDSAEASLSERITRLLVEAVQGEDAPGRVIVYIWGGTLPRGSVIRSPYLGSFGALIVQQPGDAPLGEWRQEQVDIAADYARVFQRPVRQPTQIAIGADSDDTRSESLARVGDLGFAACR